MSGVPFWMLLETWSPWVSLDPNPENTSYIPFLEAYLTQGEIKSKAGPRWPE